MYLLAPLPLVPPASLCPAPFAALPTPAGTPLVASRTGGLSDRVLEYDERRGCDGGGNGLFIEGHTHQAVLAALARALRLYRQPEHYAAMRRNAHASACDVAETARCWQAELARPAHTAEPTRMRPALQPMASRRPPAWRGRRDAWTRPDRTAGTPKKNAIVPGWSLIYANLSGEARRVF